MKNRIKNRIKTDKNRVMTAALNTLSLIKSLLRCSTCLSVCIFVSLFLIHSFLSSSVYHMLSFISNSFLSSALLFSIVSFSSRDVCCMGRSFSVRSFKCIGSISVTPHAQTHRTAKPFWVVDTGLDREGRRVVVVVVHSHSTVVVAGG